MNHGQVARLAKLVGERNRIDEEIASIIQRPVTVGHLGEWLASQIFDIELEHSAATAHIERFRSGPVKGRTVNIKWYPKREGILNTSQSSALDYYLVLTGPTSSAASSRGRTRPWHIKAVYLFDAPQLHAEQRARGAQLGTASSVTGEQWADAEIYPNADNPRLPVARERRQLLELFAPDARRT